MRAVNYLGHHLATGPAGGGGATFFGGMSTGGNTSGNTGVVSGQLVLAGGNNVTLSGSTNAASMTITVSGPSLAGFLTSQSNQAVSGSNGSFTFQTVSFGSSNGMHFYSTNGSLVGSYTVPVQSNQTLGLYASSQTTGESSSSTVDARSLTLVGQGIVSVGLSAGSLLFSAVGGGGGVAVSALGNSINAGTAVWSNSNNVSFGMAGSTITATATFPQSNQQLTLFATGNTTQSSSGTSNASSLIFRGDGFVSVGITNGSIVVSGTQTNPVVSNAIQSVGSATGSGTNTSRFAADDHVHAGVFSMGVSTMGNTAGDTRVDVGRFVFQGSNLTLSQLTAAGALNTIIISGPAPGAAAITQSIGISTQTAGGSTAGTSGYATGDDILYHFVPGSNITMSQSLNGASATLSIYGPAAGGGATRSQLQPWINIGQAMVASVWPGNGSVQVFPYDIQEAHSFSQFVMSVSVAVSTSSNSSHGGTLSIGIGFYTRNGSTLSLATSGLGTYAWTNTSADSTGSLTGLREVTGSFAAMNLTPGDYWIGFWSRTSTVNANWWTGSNIIFGTSQSQTVHSGRFNSASGGASFQAGVMGQGTFSATSAALPVSMAFSNITGSVRWWYRPHLAFRNFQA
jgi:hypothetical protein